ncbi:hypothetical protein PUNSTDRAFT_119928, partial [Punctularia strigosozonata HHB-11173 SS5]|uniref:uncharacterized protein n=1 Tax=Punctularia strigosozonata (strain HHB-11173) TaxID=741275 RepID=UPI0004417729
MFDLPPELWVKVFRLTSSSQVGKDPRGYPSLRGKPDTTKLSIIQVSRRFHDLGLQALYETVVLTRDMIRQPDGSHELRLTQRGLRLLDALERNVDRREWVREIYVRGPGRSFEGDIIDYACHDIAKFIQYCARLRTLVLFYHSVLPASLTTILGAICSVPSLELRRLYLNARPHVRDTVAVLQHCRNLNALSITESVDTLSTGEAANVLSLPRLKSLAFGTVELWDLNEVTNDHFRIFTHADMPSLCHLDAEVERVQLASLETFFASISPRITSITASVNTGMRLDTFFEDFISNFPYLR